MRRYGIRLWAGELAGLDPRNHSYQAGVLQIQTHQSVGKMSAHQTGWTHHWMWVLLGYSFCHRQSRRNNHDPNVSIALSRDRITASNYIIIMIISDVNLISSQTHLPNHGYKRLLLSVTQHVFWNSVNWNFGLYNDIVHSFAMVNR